ncbi:MAG: outer membrane beta-barrel family protein [Paramuribaculum sp.]|nr:outer membrane beta-barrel family protein [Paramuribaculum sp.]
MNHRIIISTFSAMNAVLAMAQSEATDSINSQELDEVVVEARMQRTSSNVSAYIPLVRQKNAAADAIYLLNQMAIPQIEVDPIGQTVKTASGQGVSIFIDFLPATAQDLQGMRTQDVKKVEYYLHPTDPRFQGAHYAINFIMQKYEWGGYTKVTANKWFGVNSTGGEVYSKMAYKSMIFDLYADEIYLTNRHGGVSSTEIFKFDNLYGTGPQTIERISETASSLYRNNSNDFALRALYNGGKARISNRLSYSLTNLPHNDAVNSLFYSSQLFLPTSATSLTSSSNWALSYNGNFFFDFSPKLSLEADAVYTYGKNKSNSLYSAGGVLSISNNASEDVHNFQLNPRIYWQLNEKNSFIFYLATSQSRNFIDYLGNSPSHQKYNVGGYLAGVHYDLNLEKWNIGGEFGWVWESNHISDSRMSDNFPQANVYATFSPTDKQQFELTWRYGKDVPDASQKSPNILQQDEFMWYQGTPTLADYSYQNAGLTYTWLPDNKWQLSADAYIHMLGNRCVTIYSPTGPEGTMLRRYVNDGNYRSGMLGISATAKFFGGKLVAKLRPQYWLRKTTGAYANTRNEITCTAQLTYYFGKFYLWGWYMTPSHYQEEQSGIVERTPAKYQIQFGWGDKGWNIRAGVYNFLRTSWESSQQTLSSNYYSFDRKEFSTAQHWRITFAVSYAFGYGKKVDHRDEVSGSVTVVSAILK